MNGKHILATTIYSSLLVLGMSGSAIAQDSTANQKPTGKTMQEGAPAQQSGAATQGTGTGTATGGTGTGMGDQSAAEQK